MPEHRPKPRGLTRPLARRNGFRQAKVSARIDVDLLDRIKLEQDRICAKPARRQSVLWPLSHNVEAHRLDGFLGQINAVGDTPISVGVGRYTAFPAVLSGLGHSNEAVGLRVCEKRINRTAYRVRGDKGRGAKELHPYVRIRSLAALPSEHLVPVGCITGERFGAFQPRHGQIIGKLS